MATITDIIGYEVLDSRGNPTTAAKVIISDGSVGKAYVPSGASTGAHEALELRDNDASRYHGKGVIQAIGHINGAIKEGLIGKEATDQSAIDELMLALDGTDHKSNLGANAILAVSLACARAAAVSKGQELYRYLHAMYQQYETGVRMIIPEPGFNVLNGGAHADSGLDVQEFMLMPQLGSIAKNTQAGSEIYHTLKKLLAKAGYTTSVGDEGGFAPKLTSNEEALQFLVEAIKETNYTLGKDVFLALDVAATELYQNEENTYTFEKKSLTGSELLAIYERWTKEYSITSIEDPFAEDDFGSWKAITKTLTGSRIVGDDLLVTNVSRLQMAIQDKLCNSILIKPNQIGTLTETMQAIALAHQNGMKAMISHRSGDTGDTFIADLGVATGCEYIKSGALSRGERISKYNRLIEIELEINQN